MNFIKANLWIVYFALFLASVFFVGWASRRASKRRRWPFRENEKLRRMPGQHLWDYIRKEEDNDFLMFWLFACIPMFIGSISILVARPFLTRSPQASLAFVFLAFVISWGFCAWALAKRIIRRFDFHLGLSGERYVADCLEPLKQDGWFIFHDVPCDGAKGRFNLDHVALGPLGAWVIETKSVRKGEAKRGAKDYEVLFDGSVLRWPWGENRLGLEQAANNADWLRGWIKKQTGHDVAVQAAVAIPGWKVEVSRMTPIRVINPKNIRTMILSSKQYQLTPAAIDLYSRLLDDRCRDVPL